MPGYDMGRPATPEDMLALRQRVLEAVSSLDPLGIHSKAVGQMDPNIASFDLVTFTAAYSDAGVISNKTVAQKTPSGYWAELTAISAFVTAPATNPEVLAGVKFNIKNQERSGQTFFTTELPFAAFVRAPDGCGRIDLPRGLYVFAPASGIQVDWSADTAIYTAASAKTCGVVLHLSLWGVG